MGEDTLSNQSDDATNEDPSADEKRGFTTAPFWLWRFANGAVNSCGADLFDRLAGNRACLSVIFVRLAVGFSWKWTTGLAEKVLWARGTQ